MTHAFVTGGAGFQFVAGSITDEALVDDVVKADLALLDTSVADRGATNVYLTRTITLEKLAKTGVVADSVYTDPKGADARHTHADVANPHVRLVVEQLTGIRDGVARFAHWNRKNRERYEPLVVQS